MTVAQPRLPGLETPMRRLCALADIQDGGSKGFPGPPGSFIGLFAVRRGERVFVYVNACPHIGTPLNLLPDRFLSGDGARIVCTTHGAEFRVEDGFCLRGPCRGEHLEAVPAEVVAGEVLVPADGGL